MFILFVFLAILNAFETPIPLINSVNISRGFDFLEPEQWKDNIFEWNYKNQKTYSFPSKPDVKFLVPDEQTVMTKSMTIHQSNLGIYDSYDKIVNYFLSSYHVDGSQKDNSTFGKLDGELQWIEKEIKDKNYSCSVAELYYSHYVAEPEAYFFMTFTQAFQQAINNLPEETKTKEEIQYLQNFIGSFGTHFIEESIYGGKLRLIICFNKNLTSRHSYSWISGQLVLFYYYTVFDLDHGPFSNRSQIHVDPDFLAHAQSFIKFYGGEEEYQQKDTLTQWFTSLYEKAGMVNATISTLDNLVDDTKKASVLNQAIENYIKKGSEGEKNNNIPKTMKIF